MQPTFLPWQGYFALVAEANLFVFLDDFQFVRRSYHQRNRLFLGGGRTGWVTMPVAHAGSDDRPSIRAMRPDPEGTFRQKFLGTLEHAYRQAPHFETIFPEVAEWIGRDWSDLASMNIAFIEIVARRLGLDPGFRRASELGAEGRRSSRIADLLARTEAGTYLCAWNSFDYMKEDGVFPLPDVETRFQRFVPRPYPQAPSKEFVPHLSVLDALMWVGPGETRRLVAEGQEAFVAWDERAGAPAAGTPS
jgi:hypothetical protein